ncbi:MAG: SAM-dependent methyltransferase [Anaerolineaceae bacterium 4572_32.2]|nr:MAG: SAM-dependent methyltransferase [Anaerolineaceae bacterium 4572_32.2]
MLPTLSAQEFVAKWRNVTLKERSAAQEHFIDLCRLVGHPTPAEKDPTGQTFAFEMGATKQRGGQGWADVWYKGHFAWEYKGKHKNLDRAYQQLLQYREALQNPPLLVVSDMEQIIVHTNFTNTVKRVARIGLDDLLEPEGQERLKAIFFEPQRFRAPQTTEQVTQEAANQFARLADLLRRYGAEPQQAAHFLIRLLFCLFAEDIGLLPKDLFTRLVNQTHRNAAAFAGQLRQLFQAMSTGGWFGADEIANFDGRVFDDATVLELDSDSLDILARVSGLDWSSIEPSIFGTLFERSLDPDKRSQLGAHYTGRDDILLIVEPVLMTPLRRRWAEVQTEARELARRAAESKTPRTRDNRQRELSNLLMGFAGEIAQVRVLDPACGSGNFLYVALKQLLDLWKEVSTLARDLGLPMMSPLPTLSPSPAQLHGIEVNEYAHQLAQATVWIGYIQWLHENGFGLPTEPILKPLDTIRRMDAILAYDEQGQPVEPIWPEADVVIGNPPFLGGNKIRSELGDDCVESLFRLYDGRVPASADFVCYWFEKAQAMVEAQKVKRVGLLATQAIRGGANRTILDRIKEIGNIFWAQSDRDWILDGATVHVSMIGFDNGTEKDYELDGAQVKKINSDLTSTVDLTQAKKLSENESLVFGGTKKGGAFDISDNLAEHFLSLRGNPNGRPNSDVIKPWVNGRALVGNPGKTWIVDFGVDMSQEDASLYEGPFEYIKEHVYPVRSKNRMARRRKYWWLHSVTGPAMRKAVAGFSRFIATPRVSKYRIFVWVSSNTIPDDGVYIFAREDNYFFGIVHSKIHELWARGTGTQLRDAVSGFRYTPRTCFETFPFPWPPDQEPQDDARVQAIAQAARELVEKRDRWLNPEGATEKELKKRTLTKLYNARPTWLDLAHQKLDRAVLDGYGWPHGLSDEEILERLLALNLERAGV